MINVKNKNKIRTYSDKVYTNFRRLDVLKRGIEYELFTVISIDSLLVCKNKYYVHVYLDNCACEILNKQIRYYLSKNTFKT